MKIKISNYALITFIVILGYVAIFPQEKEPLLNYFIFAKNFIKNPLIVGSIAPSSRFLANEITSPLQKNNHRKALRILEVGAGTGEFTKKILSLLKPGDTFDIIEIEPEFCKQLENLIAHEKHEGVVRIHCISILAWEPKNSYDYIISGLPFNAFEGEFVEQVIKHYKTLMQPDAVLSYFEYPIARIIKKAYLSLKKDKQDFIDFTHTHKVLSQFKKQSSLQEANIFFNVPPARVYHLQAPGKPACQLTSATPATDV